MKGGMVSPVRYPAQDVAKARTLLIEGCGLFFYVSIHGQIQESFQFIQEIWGKDASVCITYLFQ